MEGVLPFLQKVSCEVVSANLQPDQTLAAKLRGHYKPYTVINMGSEKVAVVGYTTAETPFLSMPGKHSNCLQSLRGRGAFDFRCFRVSGPHLKFSEEVEALQVQVDKLQTLGYNKIIALGHSGFDVDKQIAKRVRGVDVVIGGHTNTFLYNGRVNSVKTRQTKVKA